MATTDIGQTAPQLFGGEHPFGGERCYYCGGRCGREHAAKDIVKDSFTARDGVTLSDWVCGGCVVAMAEGIDITLIDGTVKSNQKTRGYSWIVTAADRKACTKAHRVEILDACLSPPDPPFVICISDSGQRHLLYKCLVNHRIDSMTVSLEGEPITYHPTRLAARLELCKRIAAATGKPALKEPMSVQTQMRICEYYDDDGSTVAAWLRVANDPLSRLAAWLCPPKEECANEYPGLTTV